MCLWWNTSHFFCEVEAILNDRPISQNHSSPDDFPALTPNMLLTFTRRPATSPGNFDEKDVYSKRWWRRAQHLSDVFWKRFNRDRSGLESNRRWRRTTSCLLLTRTRLAVTGQLDESWNSSEATMATFDQLKFVFVEKNSFVQFLDCAFSSSTTDVTCLFFLLNVCSVNI